MLLGILACGDEPVHPILRACTIAGAAIGTLALAWLAHRMSRRNP